MNVLSTKILTPLQKNLLKNKNITLTTYDAINVSLLPFVLSDKYENIIITSKNGALAYLKAYAKQYLTTPYNIFCVGQKTKELLEKNNQKIVAYANYAEELAKIIVNNHSDKSFLLLCGNMRRPELPDTLQKHNISFKEQQVYTTKLHPKTFKQHFDVVLFYSPSGVQSYTSCNNLNNTMAVCIGTTTANEAKKHTQHIAIAAEPTIEDVLIEAAKQVKK